MNVSELTPKPVKRVLFTLASVNQVPSDAGCYVLANFQGEIIYVGLAVDILRRFKQHRETPEKCLPTALGVAYWFYFVIVDEKEINALERGWHNQHSAIHGALPILNKIESPIS